MRIHSRLTLAAAVVAAMLGTQADGANTFRAGVYAVDITPPKFPVIVNGMFLERIAEKAHDRIYARCLVMDDGTVRLAMVVVDSCMVPRDLLDRAKEMAQARSGIPVDRMLISATHTHSAPAAMGCLGTDADAEYVKFLPARLAEGIIKAAQDLKPARAGWGVIDDHDHTHCRRWIFRPDKNAHGSFRGSQCQGQYASGLPECRRHCSLRSSGSGNFSAFHSVSGRKAAGFAGQLLDALFRVSVCVVRLLRTVCRQHRAADWC